MRFLKVVSISLAASVLAACSAARPFDDSAVDRTDLMLRVDGVKMDNEDIIKVGEILCMEKGEESLDELMPNFWARNDRLMVVEYVAEYMCDFDLANPTPGGDPDDLFANRVWDAYQRISPKSMSLSRQQMEIYSEGICEFLDEGMETHDRVYEINRIQGDIAEQSGARKWSYGEAILMDRSIVEEVCIP